MKFVKTPIFQVSIFQKSSQLRNRIIFFLKSCPFCVVSLATYSGDKRNENSVNDTPIFKKNCPLSSRGQNGVESKQMKTICEFYRKGGVFCRFLWLLIRGTFQNFQKKLKSRDKFGVFDAVYRWKEIRLLPPQFRSNTLWSLKIE